MCVDGRGRGMLSCVDALSPVVLAVLAGGVAAVATVGGVGGALLLVPLLVLGGVEPRAAVPLGLLSVTAASLAAAAPQIERGLVNHRLGMVTEVAASTGAIAGAAMSGAISASGLRVLLGVVAVGAAVLGWLRRSGDEPALAAVEEGSTAGELPGSLSGVFFTGPAGGRYTAVRVPAALVAMLGSGLVAGLTGTSGGYVKTPVIQHVMAVPAKIAAATTTFTVGITTASALAVLAFQGRIDVVAGGAVVAGAIVGGRTGAAIQDRLPSRAVRFVLSAALLAIGVVLVTT